MAEIIGGIGCSHVPAVGAALDKGKSGEPYWAPYFAKTVPMQEWTAAAKPDVAIIVYNDHATRSRSKPCPRSHWEWTPSFRSPMKASALAQYHR